MDYDLRIHKLDLQDKSTSRPEQGIPPSSQKDGSEAIDLGAVSKGLAQDPIETTGTNPKAKELEEAFTEFKISY